jgi:hypothetical protein
MVVEKLRLRADQRGRVQDIVVSIQQHVNGHLNESVE